MSGWLDFAIEYGLTIGRRTATNIYIKCCWCPDDPSAHLGLSLEGPAYGCWRSTEHRGHSPARLIKELLACSWTEAKSIARQYFSQLQAQVPDDYEGPLAVPFPPEFKEFGADMQLESQFLRYLIEKRGLDPGYVISRYKLRYALTGHYSHRVIVPVLLNQRLFAWTGRTIAANPSIPRYLASHKDNCPNSITDFLLDQDNLTGGKALLVAEGVFDCMAITSCMLPGISATCLFGKTISEKQKKSLAKVGNLYDRVAIALDPDAIADGLKLVQQLSWLLPNVSYLPSLATDFGSTPKSDLKSYLRRSILR